MSVAIKNLGAGSITSGAPGNLSPSLGGKSALIKMLTITNTGATAAAVDVTFSLAGGTAYYISKGVVIPAGGTFLIDNEITLQFVAGGTADKVAISTASSATFNFVASGLERDL